MSADRVRRQKVGGAAATGEGTAPTLTTARKRARPICSGGIGTHAERRSFAASSYLASFV